MKKFFLFAAAALVVMTSCNSNKELGPEYQEPTEIVWDQAPEGDLAVAADTKPVVSATLSNQYGIYSTWLEVWFNDDESTGLIVPDNGKLLNNVTLYLLEAELPAKPAGTKVSYRLMTVSTYNVWTWTNTKNYTVGETEEEIVPQAGE